MKDNSDNIIWKGKPKYRSKIFMVPEEEFIDSYMGFVSPHLLISVILSILFIFFLALLPFKIPTFVFILILITAIFLPDFIGWRKHANLEYVLTNSSFFVRHSNGLIKQQINLDDIRNIYSSTVDNLSENISIKHTSSTSNQLQDFVVNYVPKDVGLEKLIRHHCKI